MQHISIKQRSIFKHPIIINTLDTNQQLLLIYSFSTRKNNIKYGIFLQPLSSTLDSLHDLIPILPIQLYPSSVHSIKSSIPINSPGTYFLVFDNSYSLATTKKVYFSASLKYVPINYQPTNSYTHPHDPQSLAHSIHTTHTLNHSKLSQPSIDIQGWILKKGDISIQGYQKRYALIQTDGILTYFKTPGGLLRGYAELKTASVHVDHDRQLIDIDSGKDIFHFKAVNSADFEKWNSVIQKYVDLDIEMEQCPDSFNSSSDLSNKNTLQSSNDINQMNSHLSLVLDSLKTQSLDLKKLVDSCKGRIESKSSWKDFSQILSSISDAIESISNHATQTQIHAKSYQENVVKFKQQMTSAFQTAETAFMACFNDNNGIRNKYGLENVVLSKFIPPGAEDIPFGSIFGNHTKKGSTTSYQSGSREAFYDADAGYADSSDTNSSNASSVSDEIRNLSITESNGSSEESLQNLAISKKKSQTLSYLSMKNTDSSPEIYAPRRTVLPHPTISMDNINVVSLLRNNIGKDLSKVSMPIALNEPLNLLQKLCEELEYSQLILQAGETNDPLERLLIIAGFAVSSYSSTIHRAGRKPFNPLLGETYECVRPDKGFHFVSEKVSHHPPIMASYARGKSFKIYQDSLLKTKFWGKSMELVPSGTVHLEFPEIKEHYTWSKLTTSMRNIFSTTRYLEHYGTIKICSKKSKHVCELIFKESGYFSSSQNEVSGWIYNEDGVKVYGISGRWDQSLSYFKIDNPDSLQIIWRMNSLPPHFREMYGFTEFAVELNEITDDIKTLLPNTDTRFRTDQRLYELGKCQEADVEKARLEQKQRDYRKTLENNGQSWTPKWFQLSPDPDTDSGKSWQYIGGYFEQRGKFKNGIDLWSS